MTNTFKKSLLAAAAVGAFGGVAAQEAGEAIQISPAYTEYRNYGGSAPVQPGGQLSLGGPSFYMAGGNAYFQEYKSDGTLITHTLSQTNPSATVRMTQLLPLNQWFYTTISQHHASQNPNIIPTCLQAGCTARDLLAWSLSNQSPNQVSTTGNFIVEHSARWIYNGASYPSLADAQKAWQADNQSARDEAERQRRAAEQKAHDEKVAARTRDTNATVAGAIAVSIVAAELLNPVLEQYGAGVGASVGGNFENPDLKLGISYNLEKHFGKDFEGYSVNAGVSVGSGDISVGARKTWKVAEYVQVGVGASVGGNGIVAGPEVMFGNKDFGIGVAMFGPLPIPQLRLFGYTASIVPQLALANLAVGAASITYRAIKTEVINAQETIEVQQ